MYLKIITFILILLYLSYDSYKDGSISENIVIWIAGIGGFFTYMIIEFVRERSDSSIKAKAYKYLEDNQGKLFWLSKKTNKEKIQKFTYHETKKLITDHIAQKIDWEFPIFNEITLEFYKKEEKPSDELYEKLIKVVELASDEILEWNAIDN